MKCENRWVYFSEEGVTFIVSGTR